ncbi:alpha-tocopherol transfer protein-like [Ostrinia furnacalis]|uniref:alpha-tocopherol transfer protein-like n=1 Tax=Ostrinia furnacalis TaxID=93504 RepID=UPI00103AA500|nr:alpha-tocopherol transfer protein-like [Ostrinia furnacalis]
MSVAAFPVKKEYENVPGLKRDVQKIREWLTTQSHLPHMYITDLDIIFAYNYCDGDIESTKRVIDLNYTLRTLLSFYSNRNVDNSVERALNTWLITPLIKPTLKGYRAIYCYLLDPDIKNFVYKDAVRTFVMLMDLWQYEEGTLPEIAVIVDMDRVTLSHISAIDVAVAQQFFYYLQEAMFIRLKEFHFINAPKFVDKMLSMVKPVLTEKMLDRLKVHAVGSDTLEQHMPRSALPREGGGEYKDVKTLRDEIWNKLKANTQFFQEESLKRVNESKRPTGPHTISTFFPSIDGSFKNLTID